MDVSLFYALGSLVDSLQFSQFQKVQYVRREEQTREEEREKVGQ